MNQETLFEYIKSQEKMEGPHGWIQWKRTDVCIDVQCSCGASAHVDGRFFYFFSCEECGRKYAVGQVVKLIPLDDEMIYFVETKTDTGFTTGE